MKPIGTAPEIIAQALALGILCRPCHPSGIGAGEALEVTRSSFWHYHPDPDWPTTQYVVSPAEMCGDWELTTKDLLVAELRKHMEDPW